MKNGKVFTPERGAPAAEEILEGKQRSARNRADALKIFEKKGML